MPIPDTHDIDSLAGATYFIVGRGTEGGPSSYHLTIAGITTSRLSEPHWGDVGEVAANSGYSLGTIQVDLGQRGTWPLGATEKSPLEPGQTTYVDGIIDQASKYARDHNLPFEENHARLRTELLSHGDGRKPHGTLQFIDGGTRDSINAWASSAEGQQWIHRNIDYPQVRNATQSALTMLDAYGKNIPEDHRLETIAILAKTANQIPSQMTRFEDVLKRGGNYEDVLAEANSIKRSHRFYDGPKAAELAGQYQHAFDDPAKAAALDRAQAKVIAADFSPATSANDPDIKAALAAIGQGGRTHAAPGNVLREGAHGDRVTALQTQLASLGVTDAHGRVLRPDGDFGANTKAAVENFQRAHGLGVDGVAGPKTLDALQKALHPAQATTTPKQPGLDDSSHPGNGLYNQALKWVHALDAERGRVSDYLSKNFAGSLATSAIAQGLERIDHVVLGDNGLRAFAVQGDLKSPLKRIADVDVAEAVARPLEQSSNEFHRLLQPAGLSAANAMHVPSLQNPQIENPQRQPMP